MNNNYGMPVNINSIGGRRSGTKNFRLILVVIVVTATISSSATYWYMNTKAAKEKKELQDQVDTLSGKITSSKTPVVDTGATLSTAAGAAGDVLSLANLKNAYVAFGENTNDNSYKLTDGKYSNENPGKNKPSSIELDETKIIANPTNSETVAIVLNVQFINGGNSKTLEIMGDKGGRPQAIANTAINEGLVMTDITDINYSGDMITVKIKVIDPNDTQTVPTLAKTETYKLTGDSKLVLQ